MARPASDFSALFLAPIAGALIGTVIYVATLSSFGMPMEMVVALAGFNFAAHFVVALVAMCSIGLPWHLRPQRAGSTGLAHYFLAGVITGPATGALIGSALLIGGARDIHLYPADLPMEPAEAARGNEVVAMLAFTAVYAVIIGLIVSTSAWLIRRPDRDARTNPASTAS